MEKFISEDVWNEVNNLISEYNSKKSACISYVSTSNLNLIKGDVLICDASEESIKQGRTSVKALKTYLELGVELFSLEGLHSKLLVSDNYLVIGSANLSENSAENLIESAIITDNKTLINESNTFVKKLIEISEKITLERISDLSDIRTLNNFSDHSSTNLNRNKIFQPNIELEPENISKYSTKILFAEIRNNEKGEYVFIHLDDCNIYEYRTEKIHLYNIEEIDKWKKALSNNKYLNIYGTYKLVQNLPNFYSVNARNRIITTALKVFVLCDKDGNLLEDPKEVAMGKLNSEYYSYI